MQTIPEMTEHIKSFSLNDCANNQGFSRVLIQLFGFLGHGKSSFINTCKYVLDDTEYKTYADVKNNDGGNTTARITYPLTDTLTLVDNRGCAIMNAYETGEIFAQLGNLLPLDQEVEWSKDLKLMDRIVAAERFVQSSDFIFPIFVYSVKKGLSSDEVPEIKDLLTTARNLTGICPVVVLTHKTHSNLRDVRAKFDDMDVERVIALENFTPEDHLKTRGKHEDVLKFFLEVIKDVKFRVERFPDPDGERAKRKQFVLRFIYEMELKKKEEEMEKRRKDEERQRNNQQAQYPEKKTCILQ
ncbi:uncharacterized protein LOC130284288 [Hyla sarda]|uniref:uncharacterized protein LOC130284288 n=1 Tax=Hyla sarda TaxID=327740 RepID=UPI0024C29E64|nr:uncharacterized protein LOC130284288 [Hyla sarda]